MTAAEEWELLFECELGSHTSISGKERFIQLRALLPRLGRVERILDVGGNIGTARWLQRAFPNSEVTVLNNADKELAGTRMLKGDAQNFDVSGYDLVFAGEILEHLYNPDGLIGSALLALNPNGHLIITTPNLACIYNRLFLALGWTPGNSFPSLRYLVGNPLLEKTGGRFGIATDHKSVFTWKGLTELLSHYGAEVVASRGYSYSQATPCRTLGDIEYQPPLSGMRSAINQLLPKRLREGMLFICRRAESFDECHAAAGRMCDRLWDLG